MDRTLFALASAIGILFLNSSAQAADWITIKNSVEVNAPVGVVWRRIGSYCAIAEWMKVSCSYTSGHGELGTVRALMNGTTTEVMVAQTRHSYTYWQNKGNMAPAMFHGTLFAEAEGRSKTVLSYTLVYDQDGLPADRRDFEHKRLQGRFHDLLGVMKKLAEAK
jgi:Polyketide cyclase / dehydrase and lipid transport